MPSRPRTRGWEPWQAALAAVSALVARKAPEAKRARTSAGVLARSKGKLR